MVPNVKKKFGPQPLDFKNEIFISLNDLKISWKFNFFDCAIVTFVNLQKLETKLKLEKLRIIKIKNHFILVL